MEPFQHLDAAAVPLARPNIDTDQIFPARFLQKPRGPDFGRYLFHDLHFRPDGSEDPDFVLNRTAFRDAQIIVAERNFACGSSRENAVWALYDYGFRAALAPSFGDIFYSNSLKNGFLPIVLPPEVIAGQIARLEARPGERIGVNLDQQTVVLSDRSTHRFEIGEFAKHCLLNGLDELAYTLSRLDEITAFEAQTGKATE